MRSMSESVWHAEERQRYADFALDRAREGDWPCLADHITTGGAINADIRAFLAAVLRQEVKRPNNRPPTARRLNASIERIRLVYDAMLLRGVGREAAIDEAAEKAGVHRRTIQRELEEHEDTFKSELVDWARSREFWRDFSRAGLNLVRYEIDDTALSPHLVS